MTQLETVPNTSKTIRSAARLHSRPVVVFFVVTVSLALPAIVLAQQLAANGSQTLAASKTRAAKTKINQKERTMNQLNTATKRVRSIAADAIRPYPKIHIPQEAIDKLRRRITETQWPEKETVADSSQGVPLATEGAVVAVSCWISPSAWTMK